MEISPGPEWGCYVLYYSLTSFHLGESSLTYTMCRQTSTLNNYLSRYEKRPLSYCRLYCIPTLCLNDNIVFLSLCSHCSLNFSLCTSHTIHNATYIYRLPNWSVINLQSSILLYNIIYIIVCIGYKIFASLLTRVDTQQDY